MPMLPWFSSDSHVLEPPDLWQTRIDAAFRDRAPRIERIDGGDYVVVEADQILSGIGLISNAGARFEAPETIFAQGRFEDVLRGGYDPEQHLKDMALNGVAGEVLQVRGAGDKTLRDASSRATNAFYPALSMCDLIFSGVVERHPRLTLAIVEFELYWVPNVLISMDYTYRRAPWRGDLPVQEPALAKAGDGILPSDFFHRNVVLSFQ
jgi:hypothetical protein